MTSYTWQPDGRNVFQLNYYGTTRIFHHIVCSGHQLPLMVIAVPFGLRRFPGQTFFYFEVEIDCLSHQLQAQEIVVVSKAREEAQSILNDLPRWPPWNFHQNPVTIKRSDVDILDESVRLYTNSSKSSARNNTPLLLQSQASEQCAEHVSQPPPQANHVARARSSSASHEESDPATSRISVDLRRGALPETPSPPGEWPSNGAVQPSKRTLPETTQSNSSPRGEWPFRGAVQPSKRQKVSEQASTPKHDSQELEVDKMLSDIVDNFSVGVRLLREGAHVVDAFRKERRLMETTVNRYDLNSLFDHLFGFSNGKRLRTFEARWLISCIVLLRKGEEEKAVRNRISRARKFHHLISTILGDASIEVGIKANNILAAMSASRLNYTQITEAPSSVVDVVAKKVWSQIREIGYWQTLPEDIAIDATKLLSVGGITAQEVARRLSLPVHLGTSNRELTAEQHEAQQLPVDSNSYVTWPQMSGVMLEQLPQASQLPAVGLEHLVSREPLGWNHLGGGMFYGMASEAMAPEASGI